MRFTRDAIRRFVMATVASPTLGRPVWYELMTTDMAAAEKFYGAVVGWTSAPFAGSPNPYKVFSRSGQVQVAGLMTRPGGMNMPPFWSMYVAVPKLEDAVAQIKRLGGSELSRRDRRPDGRSHADVERPARCGLLHHSAGAKGRTSGVGPGDRRGLLARADDHGRGGGDEVLQRRLRVAASRVGRHGADGQVPDVQPRLTA